MKYIKVGLRGFLVGGSMLVPGVSGGSMAMILGIYDELIDAVSSFFKHKLESIKLLLAFSLSAIVGMILCAKPLLHLIEKYPVVMMYFFLGAVLGSIPMILRKATVTKLSVKPVLFVVIGLVLMFLIAMLPENLLNLDGGNSFVRYIPILIAGIVIAVALVLPGISVSYMLLVLGLYEQTMNAISKLDFGFLLPLAIGVFLGIILTTKGLDYTMKHYPLATYLVILGFIIASVIDVYPGMPHGINIILSILTFGCGCCIIYRLSMIEDQEG